MDTRQFVRNATITSTCIAATGFWSYAGKKRPSEKNIRWSMGWLLWRGFSGRNIPLTEAINDLNDLVQTGSSSHRVKMNWSTMVLPAGPSGTYLQKKIFQ